VCLLAAKLFQPPVSVLLPCTTLAPAATVDGALDGGCAFALHQAHASLPTQTSVIAEAFEAAGYAGGWHDRLGSPGATPALVRNAVSDVVDTSTEGYAGRDGSPVRHTVR
jgi:hypothetical protein